MSKVKNRILNIKESVHDKRNFKHTDKSVMAISLPSKISYRSDFPDIYNQGSLGTCYAFGACELIEHRRIMLGLPRFVLSKMFMSYVVRLVESGNDLTNSEMINDNGATLLNTAKAMNKYGSVLDYFYPYVSTLSYFRQKPRMTRYSNLSVDNSFNLMLAFSKLNSIKEYVFLNTVSEIKDALNKGYVVAIGIDIYNNFYSIHDKTYSGKIGDETLRGGHFVVIIGYDDEKSAFEIVNSWDRTWGDNGFGFIGYGFAQSMINKYDAFRIVLCSETSVSLPSSIVKSTNIVTSIFRGREKYAEGNTID